MVALVRPLTAAKIAILPVAVQYVTQDDKCGVAVREITVQYALEKIGTDGQRLYRGWSNVWDTTLHGIALFSNAMDAAAALCEEREK